MAITGTGPQHEPRPRAAARRRSPARRERSTAASSRQSAGSAARARTTARSCDPPGTPFTVARSAGVRQRHDAVEHLPRDRQGSWWRSRSGARRRRGAARSRRRDASSRSRSASVCRRGAHDRELGPNGLSCGAPRSMWQSTGLASAIASTAKPPYQPIRSWSTTTSASRTRPGPARGGRPRSGRARSRALARSCSTAAIT